MATPLDPHKQQREAVMAEMSETAKVHAHYFKVLMESGFTVDQAFILVRDHHQLFQWCGLSPVRGETPPWLGNTPASSRQQSDTGSVSPISKENMLKLLIPNEDER